jgi:polysaccharide biosynthesis protein PslH
MKLLFVKEELAWPRTSGHDVHTYYMMQAIRKLGHDVGMITRNPALSQATEGLDLCFSATFGSVGDPSSEVRLNWLQERFRAYWGVEAADLAAVSSALKRFNPDVLVAVGLDGLPFVAAAGKARAVWYAADEWFLHHWSLMDLRRPSTWKEIKPALVKLLYERAYGSRMDRVWVVSEADRRSMRWAAGMRHVDVLPNGVDTEYFSPSGSATVPGSCVFWGRLDFEPNVQALDWFCRNVWPRVIEVRPGATFRVIGSSPVGEVLGLAKLPNVSLHVNVPDLRPLLQPMEVAIMPFVSGGGIKNKILEAASLQKPVVCTTRALGGLRDSPPFLAADSVTDWLRALLGLWDDASIREQRGSAARMWAMQHHAWEATARSAMRALET